MSRKLTNLLCAYADFRDRYGSEDPLVKQLELEILRLKPTADSLPYGERRKNPNDQKAWNKRTFRGVAGRA